MRTKGSTSCVPVKLSQLTELLKPDATVYIWRRQADDLKIAGTAVYASTDALKAAGNAPAAEEIIQGEEIS